MTPEDQPPKSIDERLDALTANNELMSHMLSDVIQRIDTLAEISERHERQWQRTFRILRAAINEGFREDDQNEDGE